jgi:hypothetical protein
VAADGVVYAQQGTHWKQYFDGRFVQASDAPFFLHILRDQSRHVQKLASGANRLNKDDTTVILLRAMRTAIQKRFDEASITMIMFWRLPGSWAIGIAISALIGRGNRACVIPMR